MSIDYIDPIYKLLKKYGIENPRCGAGCGDGWLPLIEELIQKLIAAGWDKQCDQIKEKFGGLRFYIGAGTSEVHNLCAEYEDTSFKVCEACGKPGEPKDNGRGWISTTCSDCDKAGKKKTYGAF